MWRGGAARQAVRQEFLTKKQTKFAEKACADTCNDTAQSLSNISAYLDVLPPFKRVVQLRLSVRLEREFLPQRRCVLRIDFGNG